MNKEIFKSEKYFTFFDYFMSHGQLLIRSSKREGQNVNIDIIFFDTTFVQLFTMLHGLTISIVNKNLNMNYNSVNKYLKFNNSNLFELKSGDEKYYIAASFVKVFENELENNETSLGMLYKGRDKEIAAVTKFFSMFKPGLHYRMRGYCFRTKLFRRPEFWHFEK